MKDPKVRLDDPSVQPSSPICPASSYLARLIEVGPSARLECDRLRERLAIRLS